LSLLHAYTLKVEDGLTDKTFNKLHFAFPQASIDTLKNTEKHIQSLSGFQPMHYNCCPSLHICYTGELLQLELGVSAFDAITMQYFTLSHLVQSDSEWIPTKFLGKSEQSDQTLENEKFLAP